MRRSLLTLALALSIVTLLPVVPAQEQEPVLARVFQVHYRSLTDAADLVGTLLSEDGSITMKPAQRTLVVQDRASVLRRVKTLLEGFDLPPRTVDVTMSLFLGQRDEDEKSGAASPGSLSTEVRGMVETLGDFTKWTSYELLGSRSISGTEGDPVAAEVAGDYHVGFTVGSVHERQGVVRVKFDRFTLEREVLLGDGGKDIEELYTAGMVVEANKLTLVIAASAPDSKRALFLALQANPR